MSPLDPLETLYRVQQGADLPLPPALASLFGRLQFPTHSDRPYVIGNAVADAIIVGAGTLRSVRQHVWIAYLIDGTPSQPVALSNVEQHTWLGYYIQLPPGLDPGEPDQGSGQVPESSQQTLELRLSRYVGDRRRRRPCRRSATQHQIGL
jgi:hypothetical protein